MLKRALQLISTRDTVRPYADVQRERSKRGECVTCGRRCYERKKFRQIPITDPGRVKDGRCLNCDPEEAEITTAAVIGCGFLGARICLELASVGVKVRVYDRDIEPHHVPAEMLGFEDEYMKALRSSPLSEVEKRKHFTDACARISGCSSVAEAVGNGCGFVSEAISENVDAKRTAIAEIEAHCSEDCLITSNTLSIPLSALHASARRPDRVIGLRFLYPVLFIPYVELSRANRQDIRHSVGGGEGEGMDGDVEHQGTTLEDVSHEARAGQMRAFMSSLGKTCFETEPFNDGDTLERCRRALGDGRLRLEGTEAYRHQQREGRTRTSWDVEAFAMNEENGCVICLDGPCEVLNVGCGHKVMCKACARQIASNTIQQTCPLCRVRMHTALTFVSGEEARTG